MKQGGTILSYGGFTIVETLIVLSITAVLAISAFAFIGNRQSKTQFLVAVSNARQQIEQILNETVNGYFPKTSTIRCAAVPGNSGPPTLTTAASTQGSNTGCIFLGKVLLFAVPGTGLDRYTVYPMTGNQYNTLNQPIGQLSEAYITALAADGVHFSGQGLEETTHLQDGLNVRYMQYNSATHPANPPADIGAFGYISDVAATGGSAISGSQRFQLYAVNNTGNGNPLNALSVHPNPFPAAGAVTALNTFSNYDQASEVDICLSDGANQSALLRIGDTVNGGQASVTQHLFTNGSCT